MFVALLVVGCGGDTKKPAGAIPESNQSSAETPTAKSPEVAKIDLDDNETRNRIIAEAIDWDEIPSGYTGWSKEMHDNGRINLLAQYKDGRPDGPWTAWYSSGQKKLESNYKDGKLDGVWTGWNEDGEKREEINFKEGKYDGLVTCWYKNGQKSHESTYKNGKGAGLHTEWYNNGQKRSETTFKDGGPVTIVVWKPNGEKCPDTKLVDGNGVWVGYNEDGTERFRATYKDGARVKD